MYEADVARMVTAAAPKLMLLPDWDDLPDDDREVYLRRSARYLDGFLSCLSENADEWLVEAGGDPESDIDQRATTALLAVLRNPE